MSKNKFVKDKKCILSFLLDSDAKNLCFQNDQKNIIYVLKSESFSILCKQTSLLQLFPKKWSTFIGQFRYVKKIMIEKLEISKIFHENLRFVSSPFN